MSLVALDPGLRGATVALLVVLGVVLVRDYRRVLAGRLATAFAFGSAAHALTSGIGVTALLRLMADERIYRLENLTIGTLATKLGIP